MNTAPGWKFTLSTGDTVYARSRQEGRDLARWYRTHTEPRVTTTSVIKSSASEGTS